MCQCSSSRIGSTLLLLIALCLITLSSASPSFDIVNKRAGVVLARQDPNGPVFPDEPPSCPICARDYWNINSCCQAVPVLANFTQVIFNPGAFIDVIKCACVDTFQSAYPQCVDCLQRTRQEVYLYASSDELPGILTGIRNVCAISSTLLGNVSGANGELEATPTPPPPLPSPSGDAVVAALHWMVPAVSLMSSALCLIWL